MPINTQLEMIASSAEKLTAIVDREAGAMHEVSCAYDDLWNRTRDAVVDRDDKATKDDLVRNLDDMTKRCDLATSAIRDGVVDPKDMAREILAALCLRSAEMTAATTVDGLLKLLQERANNIAGMYAWRVAKEPI